MTEHTSLCKECKHRFRRVFIPTKSEEYYDSDGQKLPTNNENILIIQSCLVNGIDVEGEITIECNKFETLEMTPDGNSIFKCSGKNLIKG